jgi:hypothetical protein
MMRFRFLAGPILVLALSALAVPGLAQTSEQSVIDGGDVDTILAVARTYGSAILESQANGDPKISGRIDQVRYAVFFLNCTDSRNCRHLDFYAGLADTRPGLEVINAWNGSKRFGRAHLDSVQDAVVEMDLNLEFGVTRANLDASFAIWRLVLAQFTDHVGFE